MGIPPDYAKFPQKQIPLPLLGNNYDMATHKLIDPFLMTVYLQFNNGYFGVLIGYDLSTTIGDLIDDISELYPNQLNDYHNKKDDLELTVKEYSFLDRGGNEYSWPSF